MFISSKVIHSFGGLGSYLGSETEEVKGNGMQQRKDSFVLPVCLPLKLFIPLKEKASQEVGDSNYTRVKRTRREEKIPSPSS